MEHKISEKKRYQLSRIILENTKKKRISSGNYYSVLIVRVGNCSFCNETPAKKHKTSSIHADTVVGSAVPPDDDAVQPENPMGQPVVWHCGPNDLILIKPKETIQIQSLNSQHAAELLWIQYSEELLAELSEEGTDLLKSMEVVPFSCISVPTDGGTAAILKNLFTRLERSEQEKDDFGARLFEKNMLSLMIVIILRACIRSEFEKTRKGHRQFVLDDLFAYIHRHISEELTLERLEKVFLLAATIFAGNSRNRPDRHCTATSPKTGSVCARNTSSRACRSPKFTKWLDSEDTIISSAPLKKNTA